jgi:hypothetical protein
MRILTIAVLLALLFSSTTFAQNKQMPVKDIEKAEQADKLISSLDELQALADKIVKTKYYKCLKAFGDDAFCQCLKNNLPVVSNFEMYITAITSTKEEMDYPNLKDDDKKMIDAIYKVRETCVNKTAGKKK